MQIYVTELKTVTFEVLYIYFWSLPRRIHQFAVGSETSTAHYQFKAIASEKNNPSTLAAATSNFCSNFPTYSHFVLVSRIKAICAARPSLQKPMPETYVSVYTYWVNCYFFRFLKCIRSFDNEYSKCSCKIVLD